MQRLSESDIARAVAPINKALPVEPQENPANTGYTASAETCPLDSKAAVAKQIGSKRYAKRATRGIEAGCLYNPDSAMGDHARFHSDRGQDQYEFVEVTTEAFDAYLRFLRSKNPVHLRHAERAI
jgi:hypothetical protein